MKVKTRKKYLSWAALLAATFCLVGFLITGCGRYKVPPRAERVQMLGPADLALLDPSAPPPPGELILTWLGNSNLLLDDGQTRILVDGYFSRCGLGQFLFGKIGSDDAQVSWGLQQAGIEHTYTPANAPAPVTVPGPKKLTAIIPTHSHHDHAIDAPNIAQMTKAHLYATTSTQMIATGHGKGLAQIVPLLFSNDAPTTSTQIGDFEVTFLKHPHGTPGLLIRKSAEGSITAPVPPKARFSAYRPGESFSLHFHHRPSNRRILVHTSAGLDRDDMYADHPADLALLGVAFINNLKPHQRDRYYDAVIGGSGARTVMPIHWDSFFTDTTSPPYPAQLNVPFVDILSKGIKYLLKRVEKDETTALAWPIEYESFVLTD